MIIGRIRATLYNDYVRPNERLDNSNNLYFNTQPWPSIYKTKWDEICAIENSYKSKFV